MGINSGDEHIKGYVQSIITILLRFSLVNKTSTFEQDIHLDTERRVGGGYDAKTKRLSSRDGNKIYAIDGGVSKQKGRATRASKLLKRLCQIIRGKRKLV